MIDYSNEQKPAIEHQGGILLKAGAGSGKTFVLIEHICFLIRRFIEKNKELESSLFENRLKKYLNSIVLMTFTKKAAGELSVRLKERLRVEKEMGLYSEEFGLAESLLSYIFVGTIHSFCLKIINEGHVRNIPSEMKILNDEQIKLLLEDVLNDFFVKYEPKGRDDEIFKTLKISKDSILVSMKEIFMNPYLRLSWDKIDMADVMDYSFSDILGSLLERKGLSIVFDKVDFLHEPLSDGASNYLKKASEILSPPKSLEDMKSHKDFFGSYKRLPRKPQAENEAIVRYFTALKEYRDFLNDTFDHFDAYEKYKKDLIPKWFNWTIKIFNYLKNSYERFDGMTYADLEYLTLKGLERDLSAEKIRERYRYFIIDEFQDTSQVQFDIICQLAGNDFNKIFAVGDIKQAIYGFRGGEVSVFENCERRIPKTLVLKNNYRSSPGIISFNNNFFSRFFPESFFQTPPDKKKYDFEGEVEMRVREVERESKINAKEVGFLEALDIMEVLQEKNDHIETTCILYRKLASSLDLLTQMINGGLSFLAQVKIKKSETPILVIFYQLIKGYLSKEEKKATCLIINGLFQHLQLKESIGESHLKNFYDSLDEFGPYNAYLKFLYEQGVSTALAKHDLSFIKSLLEACRDNLEQFYLCFSREKDTSFSFELCRGDSPEKIQVMTVHAAKGLEFDRVILAGTHDSVRGSSEPPLFRKWPGSFRWRAETGQRKFYKSPLFILEEFEDKEKLSKENKRLFYVAGTRAKKILTFFKYSFPEKIYTTPSGSWIKFLGDQLDDDVSKIINFKSMPLDEKDKLIQVNDGRPFFHQNSLGVFPSNGREQDLLILGDLSVTGLSHLAQCPRKFYLSRVLKITVDDMGELSHLLAEDKGSASLRNSQDHARTGGSSNIQRGLNIHQAISEMVQSHFEVIEFKDEMMAWVQSCLQPYRESKLVSERPLKFSLFGLMVSGTPDLIIENFKGTKIWDFKTGRKRDEDKDYWMQLKLYAMALWALGKVDKNDSIELSLLYLDERDKITYLVGFKEVERDLFLLLKKSNSVHQTNLVHCSICDYGKLCRL